MSNSLIHGQLTLVVADEATGTHPPVGAIHRVKRYTRDLCMYVRG